MNWRVSNKVVSKFRLFVWYQEIEDQIYTFKKNDLQLDLIRGARFTSQYQEDYTYHTENVFKWSVNFDYLPGN